MQGADAQVKGNEISLNTTAMTGLMNENGTPVSHLVLLSARELQPWNGRSMPRVEEFYRSGCGKIPHLSC